jgi:CheY-like chemotaxis protein
LLAGRKLLLADDSITIQKVVELTFSDEGVNVVCVNNGREAIESLDTLAPDIVLADVFMPQVDGYKVCEYIKQSERLKHIPVMLLVGSFEPFDEAEARRVGADDTLTKPFQSIRRLIEKVGLLVGPRPEEPRASEEQVQTAEFPKVQETSEHEPDTLSDRAIKVTTADTLPLPPALGHPTEKLEMPHGAEPTKDLKVEDQQIESKVTQSHRSEEESDAGDVLLDLGDYQPPSASAADEFVLDIDLDEVPEPSPVESSYPAFAGRNYRTASKNWNAVGKNLGQPESQTLQPDSPSTQVVSDAPAIADQFARTQEFPRQMVDTSSKPEAVPTYGDVDQQYQEDANGVNAGGQISLEQLSPEVIDAIARRAVEQLSEKAVQEIAWEVVPQMAELMIKRQLEEKNS